jgi:hypothetical protein
MSESRVNKDITPRTNPRNSGVKVVSRLSSTPYISLPIRMDTDHYSTAQLRHCTHLKSCKSIA